MLEAGRNANADAARVAKMVTAARKDILETETRTARQAKREWTEVKDLCFKRGAAGRVTLLAEA